MRSLGAGDGQRTGAQLFAHDAGQMALAVAEPASEAADAFAVHDTVGDQPHRSGDDVLADVPLRRTGRSVGTATLARPEPMLLGRSRGRVVAHVVPFGGHGRAARPAVDSRRHDRGHEPAVEALVAAEHGAVAPLFLERVERPDGDGDIGGSRGGHRPIMPGASATDWRISDTAVEPARLGDQYLYGPSTSTGRPP